MPARLKEDDDTFSNLDGGVAVAQVGSGRRILIVEDDEEVGSVFQMALQHCGYDVSVVGTATDAVNVITYNRPDAIVLDLMLPDMSGLDVLYYMSKNQLEPVPTVVVSGATGGYKMNQALQAGAQRFLGKPVTIEDLMKAVHEAVAV
jgi:CheY-like chemotaxis protein